jgi:hypothetical protein
MIKSAVMGKEIVVRVINKIGVLSDMSTTLSDHGINIQAVNGYAVENIATIRFFTEDNVRAIEALKKSGYTDTKEKEVVVLELENKIGSLKNITSRLAKEGIDIIHIYGIACSGGCPAKIVFSTSNNEKALVVFKSL